MPEPLHAPKPAAEEARTKSAAKAASGPKAVGKRQAVSIPFLVTATALAVATYLIGPTILTYAIYWQEQAWGGRDSRSYNDRRSRVAFIENWQLNTDQSDSQGGMGDPDFNGEDSDEQSWDPSSFFVLLDKDHNGILEGEEIPERMRRRMSEVDSDGDVHISKDEFLTVGNLR